VSGREKSQKKYSHRKYGIGKDAVTVEDRRPDRDPELLKTNQIKHLGKRAKDAISFVVQGNTKAKMKPFSRWLVVERVCLFA
jgi:hypothetical protein